MGFCYPLSLSLKSETVEREEDEKSASYLDSRISRFCGERKSVLEGKEAARVYDK